MIGCSEIYLFCNLVNALIQSHKSNAWEKHQRLLWRIFLIILAVNYPKQNLEIPPWGATEIWLVIFPVIVLFKLFLGGFRWTIIISRRVGVLSAGVFPQFFRDSHMVFRRLKTNLQGIHQDFVKSPELLHSRKKKNSRNVLRIVLKKKWRFSGEEIISEGTPGEILGDV